MAPKSKPKKKIVIKPKTDKKANPQSKVTKPKSILRVSAVGLLKIKCPICFENIKTNAACSTSCGHVFCTQCLHKALKWTSECPSCRTTLKGSRRGYHQLYFNTVNCDDGDVVKELPVSGS